MKIAIALFLGLSLFAGSIEYYTFLASDVAPVRLCGNPKIAKEQIVLDLKGDKAPQVYVDLEKKKFEKFKREFQDDSFYFVCVFSEMWPTVRDDQLVVEAHHYAPVSPEDIVSGFSVGNH